MPGGGSERVTMVQIAAPSRTRITSYADLGRNVRDMVERINAKFQTGRWKPVILIVKQASHNEVSRWYRVADVCLVTERPTPNTTLMQQVLTRENLQRAWDQVRANRGAPRISGAR